MTNGSVDLRRGFILLIGILTGCAGQPSPPITEIRGLIIQNLTQDTVLHARIRVTSNHQFVSCQNILPRQSCSTSFPGRQPQGLPIEILWQFSQDRIKRQVIKVEGLEHQPPGSLLTAVIYLDDEAAVGEFKPCEMRGVCEHPRQWELP